MRRDRPLQTVVVSSRLYQVLVAIGLVGAFQASRSFALGRRSLAKVSGLVRGGVDGTAAAYGDESRMSRIRSRTSVQQSWMVRVWNSLRTQCTAVATRAIHGSTLAKGPAIVQRFTTTSFLYRWLTAEPEPEVIVIDLRETYSVGPVIASIDRSAAAITPGIETSTMSQAVGLVWMRVMARPIRSASFAVIGLVVASFGTSILTGTPSDVVVIVHVVLLVVALAGTRSTMSADELRETRVWQFLAEAFEPPEPPEQY